MRIAAVATVCKPYVYMAGIQHWCAACEQVDRTCSSMLAFKKLFQRLSVSISADRPPCATYLSARRARHRCCSAQHRLRCDGNALRDMKCRKAAVHAVEAQRWRQKSCCGRTAPIQAGSRRRSVWLPGS